MNNISMDVQVRNTVGNGSANRLRNADTFPAWYTAKTWKLLRYRLKARFCHNI